MEGRWINGRKWLRLAPVIVCAALIALAYGEQLANALSAIAASLVMAFVLDPLAQLMKRRLGLRWGACVGMALIVVVMGVCGIVLVAVPPLIGYVFFRSIIRTLFSPIEVTTRPNSSRLSVLKPKTRATV